ncbi:MAG: hypothetical protein JXJ18_09415 [Rhodobacteraceae bacterium]|nr:hypothetical protein [Paracoccaceae bacterium]
MSKKKKPTSELTSDPVTAPGHGVLVRAANGDVIRYDSTGLVMRLSDKVISDIAMRLNPAARAQPAAMTAPGVAPRRADPHEHLEGIDAWDLRVEGDWLHFTAHLPGRQGVRGYRRLLDGGHILADAPGPLYGILGIGGPRAALAEPTRCAFPQHVLAPADDIGAVGHAGVERAAVTDSLEQLREMTHDALVAEVLLGWQMDKYQALPLFCVRVETDGSATAGDLAQSVAFDNMIAAAGNLALAAARLGKKPKLLCITIDFALEDMSGSAAQYRDGILALMTRAKQELGTLGFDDPLFVARFESGSSEITTAAAIEGQWELAWNHGDHRFVYAAPGYMFAHDDYDRPTDAARREMAQMTAAAVSSDDPWRCPTFFLAEQSQADPRLIRVTAQAMSDLVIDANDPLGAGDAAGFRLIGGGNGATIASVRVDPDDPQALLITCDKAPEGDDLHLAYAYGAAPRPGAYPANCGAVRDEWCMTGETGRGLHRWALPSLLPVTQGANDA